MGKVCIGKTWRSMPEGVKTPPRRTECSYSNLASFWIATEMGHVFMSEVGLLTVTLTANIPRVKEAIHMRQWNRNTQSLRTNDQDTQQAFKGEEDLWDNIRQLGKIMRSLVGNAPNANKRVHNRPHRLLKAVLAVSIVVNQAQSDHIVGQRNKVDIS